MLLKCKDELNPPSENQQEIGIRKKMKLFIWVKPGDVLYCIFMHEENIQIDMSHC